MRGLLGSGCFKGSADDALGAGVVFIPLVQHQAAKRLGGVGVVQVAHGVGAIEQRVAVDASKGLFHGRIVQRGG